MVLALLAALAGLCLATDPYGTTTTSNRNIVLKASISLGDPFGPISEDRKVSGTRVTLVFQGSCVSNSEQPYTGSDAWTLAKVTKLTFSVGGSSQSGGTGDIERTPTAQQPSSFEKTVRFSSLHFADGGAIVLSCKTDIRLERWVGATMVESADVSVTASATIRAYNKALYLQTVEELVNNNYVVETSPHEAQFVYEAILAMADVPDRFEENFGNTGQSESRMERWPNDGDEDSVRELTGTWQLDDRLAASTFAFMFTHGERDGSVPSLLRASRDDEVFYDDGSSTDLQSYVQRDASVPGHNIVVLYACDVLHQDSTNVGKAWGVLDAMGGTIPAKAILGFSEVVYANNPVGDWDPDRWLRLHAMSVALGLSLGDSVSEVVGHANEYHMPFGADGSELPMDSHGDPRANTALVYIAANDPPMQGTRTWYRVF
jgi:hypothetical protein